MKNTMEYNVIGKGHVERYGRNQYLMVVSDTLKRKFEFPAIDPYDAKRQAEELCATLRIHLRQFVTPPEVLKANIDDMEAFLNERESATVLAEIKIDTQQEPQNQRRTA